MYEGKTVGRWEVGALLGMGGMGAVYEAHERATGQKAALKILLRPEQSSHDYLDAARRLRDEARAAAGLQSEGLISILDDGEDEALGPYVVYTFVGGGSLRDHLERRGRMPYPEAVRRVARPLLMALATLHGVGVVHRDVKPENLFLDDDDTFKLGDLGLAVFDGREAHTKTGTIVGTPGYVAPERLLSPATKPTAAADLYSAALVIIEAATGRRPFAGTTASELICSQLQGDLSRQDIEALGVPPAAAAPLAAALVRDGSERSSSATALLALLEAAAAPVPPTGIIQEDDVSAPAHSDTRSSVTAPVRAASSSGRAASSSGRAASSSGRAASSSGRAASSSGRRVASPRRSVVSAVQPAPTGLRALATPFRVGSALMLLLMIFLMSSYYPSSPDEQTALERFTTAAKSPSPAGDRGATAVDLLELAGSVGQLHTAGERSMWSEAIAALGRDEALVQACKGRRAEAIGSLTRAREHYAHAFESLAQSLETTTAVVLQARLLSRQMQFVTEFDEQAQLLTKARRSLACGPAAVLFSPEADGHRHQLCLLWLAVLLGEQQMHYQAADMFLALPILGQLSAVPQTMVAALERDTVKFREALQRAEEKGFTGFVIDEYPDQSITRSRGDAERALYEKAYQDSTTSHGEGMREVRRVVRSLKNRTQRETLDKDVGTLADRANEFIQQLRKQHQTQALSGSDGFTAIRHLRRAYWAGRTSCCPATATPTHCSYHLDVLMSIVDVRVGNFESFLATGLISPDWGYLFSREQSFAQSCELVTRMVAACRRVPWRAGLERWRWEYVVAVAGELMSHDVRKQMPSQVGKILPLFEGLEAARSPARLATRALHLASTGDLDHVAAMAERQRALALLWQSLGRPGSDRYGLLGREHEYGLWACLHMCWKAARWCSRSAANASSADRVLRLVKDMRAHGRKPYEPLEKEALLYLATAYRSDDNEKEFDRLRPELEALDRADDDRHGDFARALLANEDVEPSAP